MHDFYKTQLIRTLPYRASVGSPLHAGEQSQCVSLGLRARPGLTGRCVWVLIPSCFCPCFHCPLCVRAGVLRVRSGYMGWCDRPPGASGSSLLYTGGENSPPPPSTLSHEGAVRRHSHGYHVGEAGGTRPTHTSASWRAVSRAELFEWGNTGKPGLGRRVGILRWAEKAGQGVGVLWTKAQSVRN